jgi:Sec-independent protein secretion pathway component TatC
MNRPDLLYEPVDRRTKTVGVWLVAVPAALYVLAILIAGSAPVASLLIYVGAIVLYFIAIFVDRVTAPPGAVENDFT